MSYRFHGINHFKKPWWPGLNPYFTFTGEIFFGNYKVITLKAEQLIMHTNPLKIYRL